jgi:TrpR-related protein YerC/YecD
MKSHTKNSAERQQHENALYEALLQLKSAEDCRRFFADLCTPAEIEAMADRWVVVGLLLDKVPYRAIAARTGVSVVTIGRVARSLNGDIKGYRLVLEKLGRWTEKDVS